MVRPGKRALELSELVHVGREELRSLDVVLQVELLVLGVSPVVAGPDGQEHHVLAGHLLQGQGDGDGAALAGQVWFDTPNSLEVKAKGLCQLTTARNFIRTLLRF